MPSRKTVSFPSPTSWEEFEKLCCDLFARIWGDPGTQRNGRTGQPQHGVDIFGRPSGGANYAGIQARTKIHPSAKVTREELEIEVEKAKSFVPKLSQFIIATTAPNDAGIQQEARRLTQEHLQAGLFSVDVLGWGEIETRIAEYPDLIQLYYSEWVNGGSGTNIDSLVRLAEDNKRRIEARDRPTFERVNNALSSREKFTPSWRLRQASGDYIANIEWHFRGPRFRMQWCPASGSRLAHTEITHRFDLTTPPTDDDLRWPGAGRQPAVRRGTKQRSQQHLRQQPGGGLSITCGACFRR